MAGIAAAVAGCTGFRLGFGEGGIMQEWAMKPMRRIRVGIIGMGGRGTAAAHRLVVIPGVEVVAICDRKPERLAENLKWFADRKLRAPKTYGGDEGWKALCDSTGIDVVYIATPWALHAPNALRALRAGKIALVEVPGAMTVDECWELVETSEKMRLPCMMLENGCYDEDSLLGWKLAREGFLGELVHAECGYIHDLRRMCRTADGWGESTWRYCENIRHKGNQYPTHGLGPAMQALGVNRGDRMTYLVSLESDQANYEAYIKAALPADHPRRKDRIAMGDVNTTLIKTARGRSITVIHDVSSPRPYSCINKLIGTRGIFWGQPWARSQFKIGFEDEPGKGVHQFFDDEEVKKIRAKYLSPLWRKIGAVAKTVGGHGGVDFITDFRWTYCLQNGLPLDMDVYDLAACCSVCELSERSVRSGSKPFDIPDFTRGGWKVAKMRPEYDFEDAKINLGDKPIAADAAQMNV